MKKIFTLAAAVLASFSLWAADAAAPATKTYGDITFLDVAGTDANRTDKEGKDYLTYGVYYVAKTKAITTWFNSSDGSPASNHESSGYSITDAEDFGFFPTSTTSTDINYGGTKCHSGRQRYFYVTGATSVAGIVRDGGTSSNKYAQMLIQTVAEDGSLGTATTIGDDYVSASAGYVLDGGELDPAKYYKISFTSPVSSNSYMYQIRLGKSANCTDPEAHLAFTKSTAYVGEQFSYDYGSKSGGDLSDSYTLNGVPAVKGTDYTFTSGNITVLKAGQFVMRMITGAVGDYCAADLSDTILIYEANPVTAVTIDGPATGFVGQELTYTATAEGATAYQWLVDGVDANTNAATFKYTAVKGNHNIVCKARNDFNGTGEWIASDAKAVTITKLCGELIKVSATAYNAATATGIFRGTTSASMSSKDSEKSVYEDLTGYKLNTKNTHLGITFNAGQTLQAGDVATVFVTTVSAKLQLFADKGTTLIGETDNVVLGENQIILGSAANGANGIYVYRTEAAGADMNPFVAYVSVTRSCEESDNNNASVTINGEAAEKSGTVFNYTLSASYAESTVAVEITLEHPLATLMEDHAASFTMATPEAGQKSVETFKVKAENGDQAWYSIFVEKAASLNNDATLKALSVAGLTLDPAFDAETTDYTVTKAYEAAMPAVDDVTATATDANAKSVNVVLAGNVFTITVTAEDNTTTKEYTITVNSAPAIKSLSRVLFSNGFDAFIDNTNRTVKAFYLQGEEAPTATTITAGANCTAGEIVDGKIVVTGADESLAEYAVTLEAVAANTNVVEESAEAGAFDGTEAWVKAGLYLGNAAGFNEGKYVLRRQLKSGDKADDQRVIAGWVRAYFFVGNASKLELANTANKKVKYAVDGGEYTESEANPLVILLNEGNHMIEVVTNQSSGDCNLSAPKLVKRTATAIENTDAAVKAVKFFENGQLMIEKNGVIYNAQGAVVR